MFLYVLGIQRRVAQSVVSQSLLEERESKRSRVSSKSYEIYSQMQTNEDRIGLLETTSSL